MSESFLRICELCGGVDDHASACPTEIHKKALELWRKGKNEAFAASLFKDAGHPKPAMGALAEVLNLYETYRLGFDRGKQMYKGESPL